MSMATAGRADKILEAASAATYLARTRSDWSDRWEALDLDLEEHARMTKILNDTLSNHTSGIPTASASWKALEALAPFPSVNRKKTAFMSCLLE